MSLYHCLPLPWELYVVFYLATSTMDTQGYYVLY